LIEDHIDGILLYRYELFLPFPEMVHGISTRAAGTLCTGPGEGTEDVRRNLDRIAHGLGFHPASIVRAQQVHGDAVRAVHGGHAGKSVPRTDALICREGGVVLLTLSADCPLISMFDPDTPAVGLVHAGWRGSVKGIAVRAVEAMKQTFGSRPDRLLAGIGPSIGPCCYEVGPEVAKAVAEAYDWGDSCIRRGEKGGHLDLWGLNRRQLLEAGLVPEHIESAGLCTRCRTDLFFSYRHAKGPTGRFGSFLGLR
jgi:YfiH family protein